MSDSSVRDSDVSGDTPDDSAGGRSTGSTAGAGSSRHVVATGSSANGSSTQPRQILIDGQNVSPDDATVITDRPPTPPSALQAGATPAELGRILEGERLGHFELDKFIGGGGMGAVFQGTDTALGRTVAVKVLLRQYASDEETIRRFQNEAQSAARLDHDNIARVYYVGEDRGWHYIVLEFIEGENLRDLVHRSGPLHLSDVITYTLQLAQALAHASKRDVVHRDIKPSNVLITTEGRAKLVDMGLARLHQVDRSHDDLTATGVTLGTFDYISPEQARDPRIADVRSDLYSLGCTVYFMLTGRPPFPEGTVLQKLLQHQGDAPPDPRQFRDDLPSNVCHLTKKLLAKNPKDRFQEPNQLVAELLLLSEELGLSHTIPDNAVWVTAPGETTSWHQRHLPWLVPLGLLFVVAGLVHYSSRSIADAVPPGAAERMSAAVSNGKQGVPEQQSDSDQGDASQDPASADASKGQDPPDSSSPAKEDAGETTPTADEDGGEPTADGSNGGAGEKPPGNGSSTESAGGSQQDTPGNGSTEGAADTVNGHATNGGPPLLIVSDQPEGDTSYRTLAEACQHAKNGDVIELRYDGRLDRAEQPISVAHRKLTIRAGEGFQPVVRFVPAGPDRVLHPRSMIHVAGGDLNLSNVHFELDIPTHVRSENWTLFEAVLADRIRLLRCTMTIRNAAGDLSAMYKNVSFFSIKAAPRRLHSALVEAPEPLPRLQLELRDCIARGEATFLNGTALHAVQLQWENGLLATTERFVDVEGQGAELPAGSLLEIDLKNVTAMTESGFCRMISRTDERHMTATRIDCTDCILITNDSPLIEQIGLETEQELMRNILWNAARNFYENQTVFWRIDTVQNSDTRELNWIAWQNHWGPGRERLDRPLPVLWGNPVDVSRPVSDRLVEDFLLDDSDINPARGAGTDGVSDAGMQIDRLSPLPFLPKQQVEPQPPATGSDSDPRGGDVPD